MEIKKYRDWKAPVSSKDSMEPFGIINGIGPMFGFNQARVQTDGNQNKLLIISSDATRVDQSNLKPLLIKANQRDSVMVKNYDHAVVTPDCILHAIEGSLNVDITEDISGVTSTVREIVVFGYHVYIPGDAAQASNLIIRTAVNTTAVPLASQVKRRTSWENWLGPQGSPNWLANLMGLNGGTSSVSYNHANTVILGLYTFNESWSQVTSIYNPYNYHWGPLIDLSIGLMASNTINLTNAESTLPVGLWSTHPIIETWSNNPTIENLYKGGLVESPIYHQDTTGGVNAPEPSSSKASLLKNGILVENLFNIQLGEVIHQWWNGVVDDETPGSTTPSTDTTLGIWGRLLSNLEVPTYQNNRYYHGITPDTSSSQWGLLGSGGQDGIYGEEIYQHRLVFEFMVPLEDLIDEVLVEKSGQDKNTLIASMKSSNGLMGEARLGDLFFFESEKRDNIEPEEEIPDQWVKQDLNDNEGILIPGCARYSTLGTDYSTIDRLSGCREIKDIQIKCITKIDTFNRLHVKLVLSVDTLPYIFKMLSCKVYDWMILNNIYGVSGVNHPNYLRDMDYQYIFNPAMEYHSFQELNAVFGIKTKTWFPF